MEVGKHWPRWRLIDELKKYGKRYNFDKYSDPQLFMMLNRIVRDEERHKMIDDAMKEKKKEPFTAVNDPKFNFDDPDREGEYEVEQLKESFKKIELDHIDEKYYDLVNLYEAIEPKLSAQDKTDIKRIIDTTNDPAVIQASLQAKLSKDESLNEDEKIIYEPIVMTYNDYLSDAFVGYGDDEEFDKLLHNLNKVAKRLHTVPEKMVVQIISEDEIWDLEPENLGIDRPLEEFDNYKLFEVNGVLVVEASIDYEEAFELWFKNQEEADRYKEVVKNIHNEEITESLEEDANTLTSHEAEEIKDIIDHIPYNGAKYRGATIPSPVEYAINQASIPDNMRLKHFHINSDLVNNEIYLSYITQEPFDDKDAEQFHKEVLRCFNEVLKKHNLYPMTLNTEVISRDGEEYGYATWRDVIDFTNESLTEESLKEMAMERNDAIDRCYSLGLQFLNHFQKIYDDNNEETIKHHAAEMQNWLNQVLDITLKSTNKKLSRQQLYDWFITACGNSFDHLNNYVVDDVYNQFAMKVLDNHDVVQSLKDVNLLNDSIIDEDYSSTGYGVEYITGYAGMGINNTTTDWYRTEQERDTRVKELMQNHALGIKKVKWDNFYHDNIKDESLEEDTIKTSKGKWVNKGEEGTHGTFDTKKEADAQRKAMFANGYKESMNEKYLRFRCEEDDEIVNIINDAYGKGTWDEYAISDVDPDLPIKVFKDGKIVHLVDIENGRVFEENLNEDYIKSDDDWGTPLTDTEVENKLSELTNRFKESSGNIRCWYEVEKQSAIKILKNYYDIVEVSDDRRDDNDEINWIISYSNPKK